MAPGLMPPSPQPGENLPTRLAVLARPQVLRWGRLVVGKALWLK
jgi:hypothetical protein